MNYSRILLSEVEKKRILGLHETTKKNPTTGLLNEELTEFPECVRYAGPEVSIDQLATKYGVSEDKIKTIRGYLNDRIPNSVIVVPQPNKDIYLWLPKQYKIWLIVKGSDLPGYQSVDFQYYHCKCENGKLRPRGTGKQNKEDEPCQGGDQGGGKDGGKISNCRSKTPIQVCNELGLNFKDTQKKWIESSCNGTQPCSYDEARTKGMTNINLRNALCDGKWKPGGQGTNPITDQACKEKCSQQPKEVPPGAIVTQQIGYFFDNKKGECVGVTGQSGPFQSLDECKKCNCGNKNDQGIVIKLPTLIVLLECVKRHLKLLQLPTSCQSDRGTLPTDPTKCFQDLLNGKTIVIIIEFLMCLFPSDKIPSPIDQIPIKIPDEKNPGQEIEVPIIKIPGVDIPIFQPPVITPIKPKD